MIEEDERRLSSSVLIQIMMITRVTKKEKTMDTKPFTDEKAATGGFANQKINQSGQKQNPRKGTNLAIPDEGRKARKRGN